MPKIYIIGFGGHAKQVIDTAYQLKINILGYYDDNNNEEKNGIKYCGKIMDISKQLICSKDSDIYLFCAIGDNYLRYHIWQLYKDYNWINLIHPSAQIASGSELGSGNYFGCNVSISAPIIIGNVNIFNDGCRIAHDCTIEDANHFSLNTTLPGHVKIKTGNLFGISSVCLPIINVESWNIIGGNSLLTQSITNFNVYVGSPAHKIRDKIRWLNTKNIDWTKVKYYLEPAINSNQFTNFGYAVTLLENRCREYLKVTDDKAVIVVSSGAGALTAVGSVFNHIANRKLKYATQSYTFPCSAQTSMSNCQIVDIDEYGGPDINQIDDDVDVLIVTNILGNIVDVNKYEKWARENNKLLIFDNAATSYTFYQNKNSINYGNASVVSLHHTKPIGFGEGGIIIIDKQYLNDVKKIINFGYDMIKKDQIFLSEGSNYKMSEISASYILQYFENFDKLVKIHQTHYEYFNSKLKTLPNNIIQNDNIYKNNIIQNDNIYKNNIYKNKVSLLPNASTETPFVGCFCLLFPHKVELTDFPHTRFEIRKYYKPLNYSGKALDWWERIICYPCHSDMKISHLDDILNEINSYLLIIID
jgi:acetyltransferase EpsM